ncbi:hypothetical protein ABID65_006299 [Bradyrhizobium sp. S3.9.2]
MCYSRRGTTGLAGPPTRGDLGAGVDPALGQLAPSAGTTAEDDALAERF